MQLELGVTAAAPRAPAPRVLALCFPDLPLQRALGLRETSSFDRRRTPLAVERAGRVIACDPEARARGVRAGDSPAQARAACAGLELVPADDAADRAALEAAAEALLALAPAVEVDWPDTLLLDASGASVLSASGGGDGEVLLMEQALALTRELGLRCRAAVASGRAPCRALARHGGTMAPVSPGRVANALAGLPVEALGLEPALAVRLAALGLREIGDLARLPPETLPHRLGPAGLAAWRLAQGDDPSPLTPYVPRLLPEERLEFEAPLESAEPLLFALKRACDRIAARLAGRGLGATRLALTLRLDDRTDEHVEVALAAPSCAAARWLLVIRERVTALRPGAPVVAVVVAVADAAPCAMEQLAIGDRPRQLVALEAVLSRLAGRLGEGAVFAATRVDRHRPEAAYGARAFAAGRKRDLQSAPGRERGAKRRRSSRDGAAREQDPARPHDGEEPGAASPDSDEPTRPTRLLPEPQPLVALGEGGRLAAVRLGTQTFRVLALSPAERLAGEWWADPYDRDYHRARLEGLGECWIFRDASDGRLWLHGLFD